MAEEGTMTIYNRSSTIDTTGKSCPVSIKRGIAQMLCGGAILEVINPKQAKIAEECGACAVVVTENRHHGGVSRMPDLSLIKEIKKEVSIPVMARARVGHFVEAQILEQIGVDFIDESEILSIADEDHFINKHNFRCQILCGCKNLHEALQRVQEGACMLRIQGVLTNSGDISQTVKSIRSVMGDIRVLNTMNEDEVFAFSKTIAASDDLVARTKEICRLPVVQFAAGGIMTPADAALMMQLGCDGVFVGSEVFDCVDPYKRVRGIVQAVWNNNDSDVLAECSYGLEDEMGGIILDEDRSEKFGISEITEV